MHYLLILDTTLSSPSWDSSCSCSEVAVKGKKCKVNMQREPDKLRSVYWLLTQVQDCENWKNLSKDLSKLLCFWVVSTGCAHPFPKGIKSMVQSVEGMGSELRAAVWCPSLLCETSGVPSEAAVETCQFWLLLPLWTLNPGIQIKRILIKECQSDFSHFDEDWWAEQAFACYSAPFTFCLCAHQSVEGKHFPVV